VRKLRVHGHAQDLAATLLELVELAVEGDDLRGTNKGEVQRVEEEDRVLPAQG